MSQSDRPSLAIWPVINTDKGWSRRGWLSLLFALAFALALLPEIAGGWQETARPFPAETVAGVFVCLGSDYLRGGRVSRRMGGGSFPPDVLSNLATRYHRAGG